jgi:hypothetical protein
MLMQRREPCVLHVADVADGEALETLCRTTQVIATAGVDQVLLVLAGSRDEDVIWSAALAAEVRPVRCSGAAPFGRLRALQSEFSKIASERELRAVHLHGLGPCLLGSRALKGSPLRGRLLYSPHLACSASPWTAALLGRLLQSLLEPLQGAAVTASLMEAQTLSKLLNRSAEVLPHPVSDAFFEAARQEGARPSVLADGFGARAVDIVTRLSVLLNSREDRVPISWLGMAEAGARAQLDAASVPVLAAPDDVERAQSLSRASAFIHISSGNRVPLAAAQAMAAGVPCLVSDTPPHRALIRHGETGFVCTSERDFLEKLILLLRDRVERERIGQAARAEAERCFTSRHFERAILRAYGFSGSRAVSHVH